MFLLVILLRDPLKITALGVCVSHCTDGYLNERIVVGRYPVDPRNTKLGCKYSQMHS